MSSRLTGTISIVIVFLAIAYMQYAYDLRKIAVSTHAVSLSPQFIKSFDLGLNSALASFFWIDTRTELPFLQSGAQKFFGDLDLINNLDPKFSVPYEFTVLVLPNTRYSNRIAKTIEIGMRGIQNADTDWKIPFYLAVTYDLYVKDRLNAAKYFDMAALMPGIPETVKRFAINYGTVPDEIERTKQLWTAIYESTTDDATKERAKAFVAHFELIQFLNTEVGIYKNRYGHYPVTIDDLVTKNIITAIPPDPFGLEFQIYEKGVVGIKQLSQ